MVDEITPREFVDRQSAGSDLLMLDVREANERELAAIDGCLWIPMGEVPDRLGEIDRDRLVVVMCRSGGRSLRVANYLSRQGFPRTANLTGGILRRAQDVEPGLPTY